jgi:lysophospholipase
MGNCGLPDSLSPVLPAALSHGGPVRQPALPERFLPPPGFEWGSFTAADGAVLRWGHLPVASPRAECVMVGGFGEFIEKQFETVRDLAARGIAVWCLDWRGQGGSIRPRRLPTRPRARKFDRDAEDLAAFAAAKLPGRLPRLLVAHSMGGAIALLCLRRHPRLFAAAVLSSPMVGLRTGKLPPSLIRCITRPARVAGLGACFIPGARKWRPDRLPSPERSRVTTDAERCRLRHAWFSADPKLRLDEATYGWVDSALGLVARISKPEFLTAIRTPILLGRPEREVVVSTKAQRRAAGLLPNCTLVELRESKHDPFLERDPIRDYWLSCLDRFIAERLVKTPH